MLLLGLLLLLLFLLLLKPLQPLLNDALVLLRNALCSQKILRNLRCFPYYEHPLTSSMKHKKRPFSNFKYQPERHSMVSRSPTRQAGWNGHTSGCFASATRHSCFRCKSPHSPILHAKPGLCRHRMSRWVLCSNDGTNQHKQHMLTIKLKKV